MDEREVKFLEVDVPALEQKLEELGAERAWEGPVVAEYYDFADKRLSAEEKSLRLRTRGEIVELTMKRRLPDKTVKVCEEFEVRAGPVEAMREILRMMGLRLQRTLKKDRVSYVLEDAHVEFDTPPDIPTYLEIEAASLAAIARCARALGLSMKNALAWSAKDVLEHYAKRDASGKNGKRKKDGKKNGRRKKTAS